MKNNFLDHRSVFSSIGFLVLVFLTSVFATAIQAQQLPIALKKNTPLSPINRKSYEEAAQQYQTETGKTIANRNRLIAMTISQIDLNFGFYQRNRRIQRNLFATVVDILEIGASTAISITGGARSKALIGEGLTFVQGSRDKINKNLRLQEQQIFFNKMIEKRADVQKRILGRLNNSIVDYPFELAYVDLVDYYEAGTMSSALADLAADTGSSASDAQNQLRKAKENAGVAGKLTEDERTQQIENFRKIESMRQAFIDAEDANNPSALTAKQKEVIKTYRLIYNQIQADDSLREISDKLPDRYTKPTDQTTKARITKIVKDLGENKEVSDLDYDFYLLQMSGAVKGKIANQTLAEILETNKL